MKTTARLSDLRDRPEMWWTVDEAAEHFGLTRATVERYIRDGLPLYFKILGGFVKRDEFLAERRRRMENLRATRARSKPP